MSWQPTEIKYSIGALQTSTGVVRVMTDVGVGYLKALGNSEGPHALVREFVGTAIANLLGLRTLEYHIIRITEDDDIILGNGQRANTGPAFITAEVEGVITGFCDFKKVINTSHFAGLVIADTLLLNKDRYPGIGGGKPNFDNLMFKHTQKGYELIAIDFSHCMHFSSMINKRLSNISATKSDSLYGLFNEFRPFIKKDNILHYSKMLDAINEENVKPVLSALPVEWDVTEDVKNHITNFLINRAEFLKDNLETIFARELKGTLFL